MECNYWFFNDHNPFKNDDDNKKKDDNKILEKKNTIDETRTEHIFRDAEGHFSKDTPANRAALEEVANNPNAYNGYSEATGNHYYSVVNQNGTQAWAIVRDGKIINGGINLEPYIGITP